MLMSLHTSKMEYHTLIQNDNAKEQSFELCYLETLPYMKAAQKLYLKTGFSYIDGPMGNTGHTSCNVWLTKAL